MSDALPAVMTGFTTGDDDFPEHPSTSANTTPANASHLP
jgi:hypothetical protein